MRNVLWVDADTLTRGSRTLTVEGGVRVTVHVSPYDLPQRVAGRFDEKRRKFVIEFEYIDDESQASPVTEDEVTFIVGRHSGKLLEIRVPIETPLGKTVKFIDLNMKPEMLGNMKAKVLGALKERRGHRLDQLRGTAVELNQDVVEEVLERDFDTLVRMN